MTSAVTRLSSKSVGSYTQQSLYSASNHSVMLKVVEDIRFLEDRIDRMNSLKTPNTTLLKTYQTMLDSRESVLEWLKEKSTPEQSADEQNNAETEEEQLSNLA